MAIKSTYLSGSRRQFFQNFAALTAFGHSWSVFERIVADVASEVVVCSAPPDRWEAKIRELEHRMAERPVKPGGIVFAGSSSIRLWDVKTSFPEMPISNQGFGGSHIVDSIHFYDRIIAPLQPSAIVLYAGDNDVAAGREAETVRDDFAQFVKTARQANGPTTVILFISIKPSLSRWKLAPEMRKANQLIQEYCRQQSGLEFVDLWNPMLGQDGTPQKRLFQPDGLHLNGEGYRLWTATLAPRLVAFSGTLSR